MGGEGADVPRGNQRQRPVGRHRQHEPAFAQTLERPLDRVVVHERGRAEDRPGHTQPAQVPFDAVFAVEVRDARAAVGVRCRGEHDVPDAAGGLQQVDALSDLGLRVGAEWRGHRKQSVGALQGGLQRLAVVEVGRVHLGAEDPQRVCGGRVGSAGQGADLEALIEQRAGGRAALGAGRSGDGHHGPVEFLRHAVYRTTQLLRCADI